MAVTSANATSSDPTLPPPGARWWAVAVFSLAGLVSYTDRVVLGVLVDPIRRELAISDSEVSLLQGAAFAIIYVLAGLPLGRLADRTRRINLVIAGSAIWSLGTLACGLAPGFWSLFTSRLLVGVGEAALAPAAISIISDSFPPAQRGTAVGVFLTGMVAGGPAAVTIGGVLLGAADGGAFAGWPVVASFAAWRVVLIVIGIFGLVVPFLAATIREPPRFERTGSTTPNLRQAAAGFVSRGGALVPLYLGMALLSIGDYGVLSWMPSLLSRRFAMSPAAIGGVFGAVSAAGGITGSLIGGILSDRAERRGGSRARLAAIAVAAFVAGAGAFFLAGARPGVALAGLGIWTFASALAGTGGMAALGVVVPNEIRGVGVSLVAFCNTLLGLGLGPTVVALTTDHVYRNPVAVGLAMATAIVPAGVLAALLFARSAVRLGRAAHTSVPA